MCTAIAIGDPHFKVDNIPDVEIFIEKMEMLVKEVNPDFIVVLGDLLHTHERLHTIPLNKAYDFINMLRKYAKTFILVGNHDMCNNSQFLTENHWMNGMKEWENVVVVDRATEHIQGEHYFVLCPYVPPGRFQEALESLRNSGEWRNSTCIFAHQEFFGCKMGAIVSVEGDRWTEDLPPVVSGHIHSRQTIKNVYYPGSSMQHAFGENENCVIPVLKWSGTADYSLKEMDLGMTKKKIVYTDIQAVEDYVPEQKDPEKIKITITGDASEVKAFKKTKKYKELLKSGSKVVFKQKKIAKEENTPEINEKDFVKILHALVTNEKNPLLHQLFELVINNKNVDEDDVLFL